MDEQLIITETEFPKIDLSNVDKACEKKIIEELKPKCVVGFYMKPNGEMFVDINTKSEAFLALALRKLGHAVDIYLAEQDIKKIQDANRIIKATVPQSIADKLRL